MEGILTQMWTVSSLGGWVTAASVSPTMRPHNQEGKWEAMGSFWAKSVCNMRVGGRRGVRGPGWGEDRGQHGSVSNLTLQHGCFKRVGGGCTKVSTDVHFRVRWSDLLSGDNHSVVLTVLFGNLLLFLLNMLSLIAPLMSYLSGLKFEVKRSRCWVCVIYGLSMWKTCSLCSYQLCLGRSSMSREWVIRTFWTSCWGPESTKSNV